MPPFCRLALIRSVAQVLRRGWQIGADLGAGAERTVLLNPLALCVAVDRARKRADVGIRPYGGRELGDRAGTQADPNTAP